MTASGSSVRCVLRGNSRCKSRYDNLVYSAIGQADLLPGASGVPVVVVACCYQSYVVYVWWLAAMVDESERRRVGVRRCWKSDLVSSSLAQSGQRWVKAVLRRLIRGLRPEFHRLGAGHGRAAHPFRRGVVFPPFGSAPRLAARRIVRLTSSFVKDREVKVM